MKTTKTHNYKTHNKIILEQKVLTKKWFTLHYKGSPSLFSLKFSTSKFCLSICLICKSM